MRVQQIHLIFATQTLRSAGDAINTAKTSMKNLIKDMTKRAKELIPFCTMLEDLESRLAYEFEMTEEEVKEVYMPTILEEI